MGQPATDSVLAYHNVHALPLDHSESLARSSRRLDHLVCAHPLPLANLSTRCTTRCAQQRRTATCSPRKLADVAPTSRACVGAVSLCPYGL